MKVDGDENSFYGVVKIETIEESFLLEKINKLEVDDSYVVNSRIHSLSKGGIYTLIGPEFGEW